MNPTIANERVLASQSNSYNMDDGVDPFGGRSIRQPRQQQQQQKTAHNERAIGGGGRNNNLSGGVDPFGGKSTQQPRQQQRKEPDERVIGDGRNQADPFASADPFGQGNGSSAPPELKQCPDCGRKFNPISYAKHTKNCKKVFQTKRKAFDMKKARIGEAIQKQGGSNSSSSYGSRNSRNSRAKERGGGREKERKLPSAGNSKWKQQSSALREAMKQSRMVAKYQKEGRLHELPAMAPAAVDPSFVPCPHCGRSFNQKAAARHIPKCAGTKAKPKRLIRGSGNYQSNAARIRSTKSSNRY
jgi:uncharacterized C2H2 Zn-finger protein